jgi:glucokinase
MEKKFIGFDIGGTFLAASLGVLNGDRLVVKDSVVTDTKMGDGEDFLVKDLLSLTERLFQKTGVNKEELAGVGISTGGPLDIDRGCLDKPTYLRPDGDVKLVKPLEDFFSLPVKWTNDANAAALLEYLAGKGMGSRSMIYYTVSTGIGWALVNKGEIYEGFKGNTEGGHFIMKPGGPLCNCGLRGCLESLASGTAYKRLAHEAIERGEETCLKVGCSAKDVFDVAKTGDPLGKRLVDQGVDYLARHMSGIITTLNPQRIVLGGGITRQGDFFFNMLKGRIREHSQPAGNLRAVDYIGPSGMGAYLGIAAPFALLMDKGRMYTVAVEGAARGVMDSYLFPGTIEEASRIKI